MLPYRLPDHLYFCLVDGQRVFLDLARDLYFSLPPAIDPLFTKLMNDELSPAEADVLSQAGLIVSGPKGRIAAPTSRPLPERSLLEESAPVQKLSVLDLFETWLLVSRARRAVIRKKLPLLLRQISSRPKRSVAGRQVHELSRRFVRARRLVPIAPNCLYDSLALCGFLQRRDISPDLVIGTKLHPFGAHCWVEDGTVLLNETLAGARGFVPVLTA